LPKSRCYLSGFWEKCRRWPGFFNTKHPAFFLSPGIIRTGFSQRLEPVWPYNPCRRKRMLDEDLKLFLGFIPETFVRDPKNRFCGKLPIDFCYILKRQTFSGTVSLRFPCSKNLLFSANMAFPAIFCHFFRKRLHPWFCYLVGLY